MDIIAGGALVDVAHMLTDSTSNVPTSHATACTRAHVARNARVTARPRDHAETARPALSAKPTRSPRQMRSSCWVRPLPSSAWVRRRADLPRRTLASVRMPVSVRRCRSTARCRHAWRSHAVGAALARLSHACDALAACARACEATKRLGGVSAGRATDRTGLPSHLHHTGEACGSEVRGGAAGVSSTEAVRPRTHRMNPQAALLSDATLSAACAHLDGLKRQ